MEYITEHNYTYTHFICSF